MACAHAHPDSVLERSFAAAFVVAALAVAALGLREFRTASAVPSMTEPAGEVEGTMGVLSEAVSVPSLVLSNGRGIRVGERLSAIAARLGRQPEVERPLIEPVPLGERLTRVYDDAGTRFVLVFEPFDRGTEPRVAAIYLR